MNILQMLAIPMVVLTFPALATPLEVFPEQPFADAQGRIYVSAASFTSLHTKHDPGQPSRQLTLANDATTQTTESGVSDTIRLLSAPIDALSDKVSAKLSMDAPAPSVGWLFAVTLSGLFIVGRNKQQDR